MACKLSVSETQLHINLCCSQTETLLLVSAKLYFQLGKTNQCGEQYPPKNNRRKMSKKIVEVEEKRKRNLPEGTIPERELLRTSSSCNWGALAIPGGIGPNKRLKPKSSLLNNPKFPKLAGIWSVSLLYCNARTFSLFKDPISLGMRPVSWLQHSSKTTKQRKSN